MTVEGKEPKNIISGTEKSKNEEEGKPSLIRGSVEFEPRKWKNTAAWLKSEIAKEKKG